MKKIAIYTESFPPKSGGVAVAQYNLYHLLKAHFDVKVFVFFENEESNTSEVIKRKAPDWIYIVLKKIITFYLNRRVAKNKSYGNVLDILKANISVWRLNKYLQKFNPDVIIIPDHFLPAYRLKKPKQSILYWAAHHNYSRFQKIPLIKISSWADLYVCHTIERKLSAKTDNYICPSSYICEVTKDTLANKGKAHIIPNFIISNLLNDSKKDKDLLNKMKINPELPIIYIPSASSDLKGKRYIFEIIRRLIKFTNNEISFYLSGEIHDDLQFELKFLKNVSLIAPGQLWWEENISLVNNSYLGITPTLVENFSYAILEAQTAGIPFVAFDTGGNNEIIEDSKTGYIVPYLDIELLLERVYTLIENKPLRDKMGENAKTRCQNLFRPEVILTKYQEVFQ